MPLKEDFRSRGQAVLGRQQWAPTQRFYACLASINKKSISKFEFDIFLSVSIFIEIDKLIFGLIFEEEYTKLEIMFSSNFLRLKSINKALGNKLKKLVISMNGSSENPKITILCCFKTSDSFSKLSCGFIFNKKNIFLLINNLLLCYFIKS